MNTNKHKYSIKNITELTPYARNSRTHSDEQVSQIAASIKEFGFTNPVLVDDHGGIIAGHGRVMAAQRLKLDSVPVITLRGLTEAQKRAYVIADNKLALNAGWDNDMLAVELQELQDLEFDMSLTGFSVDEFSDLLVVETVGLTDEDAVPEVQDEPVTKPGDVWQLGNHRLMCGDSTSIDAVEKLMAGSAADMIFTDPPYGMSYDGGRSKKNFGMIKNDDAQGGAQECGETLPAIQELVYIIDSCECDTAKSLLYNKLEELLGRL